MEKEEARKLYAEAYRKQHDEPGPESDIEFVETMASLIRETEDTWAMSGLGAWYYDRKRFDLALKYYQMAYDHGDHEIACSLGYIWYYGRTGEVNYELAYRYFQEAADHGDLNAKLKLADMIHNGYYVPADEKKYARIVEQVYREAQNDEYPPRIVPYAAVRLAKIRKAEGNIQEAVLLYRIAKKNLIHMIELCHFFGDINVMEWLMDDLYTMIEPDYSDLDLYDLFYVLKTPKEVTFRFKRGKYMISSCRIETGEPAFLFEDRWYRSFNELLLNAMLDGQYLSVLASQLYDFEVNYERTC